MIMVMYGLLKYSCTWMVKTLIKYRKFLNFNLDTIVEQ